MGVGGRYRFGGEVRSFVVDLLSARCSLILYGDVK